MTVTHRGTERERLAELRREIEDLERRAAASDARIEELLIQSSETLGRLRMRQELRERRHHRFLPW